jgi:hypothetical protein
MALIGHAFLAIAAGFAIMAVLVIGFTAVLTGLAPQFVNQDGRPRPAYMIVNLLFSAAFAVLGGWVTARLAPAPGNPLTLSLMLAFAVLLMSGLSAIQLRGQQPLTYQLTLIVISPVAVVLGGMLRLHQLGYRW